jgi:formimidoylglutamate deiminase
MSGETEKGWLPDFIYAGGVFQSGVAMFAEGSGRITRFSREPGDLAKALRLANCAILPGLVNAHSHAFQRVIRGRTEHRTTARRDTFWTWRECMYRAATLLSPDAMYQAARMAFLEMLLSGITTVGEFHYVHHAPGGAPYEDRNLLALEVLRAAGEVGLRIALLRTAYERAGWRKDPDPRQARFFTPRADEFIADVESLRAAIPRAGKPGHAWVGIAPHSIRAVSLPYLHDIARFARANHLPMHMHVAEQPAEIEACLGEYGLRPVELLSREGILDFGFTAIHAIHVTNDEIGSLAETGAKVCACPTTERNLGDGAVPADRLAELGVGICLGSDSNVQIDLLEDARLLEYHLRMNKLERAVLAPDLEPDGLAKLLFISATETGAACLGAPGGSLSVGRPADFFTLDLNDPSLAGAERESLLNHIVFSVERTAIRDVYVNGEIIIRDGRHPLQESIIRDFAVLQRSLWC